MQPVLCKHFGVRDGLNRFGCVYLCVTLGGVGSYLVVENSRITDILVSVLSPNLQCFLNVLPPSGGDMPSTVATQPPHLHRMMRNLRGGGVRVGTGQQTGKSLSLMKSLCRLLVSERQLRLVF